MKNQQNLAKLLFQWYAENGRELPWRHKGGAHPNPYIVLVSEFMLQQTTVKTVIPYFVRFMERFPTVQDLADATLEDVYHLWQGLGYYTRAKSLHTTAQIIVRDFGGKLPCTKEDILKLKGIGEYSAASILALAFNLPETVIDGNVMRIIARLYHLTAPLDEIREIIRNKANALTSLTNPADYASAIMDLGAMVCTPKKPQCLLCPWREFCASYGKADLEDIPCRRKITKKEQTGRVYLVYNSKGEVLIRKRSGKGLLTGLYEFPWGNMEFTGAENSGYSVTHIFTHIRLTLQIYTVSSDELLVNDGVFVAPDKFKDYAFSTLMKKIWKKML